MVSAEQKARDLLSRAGVADAASYTAGDLVELANVISMADQQASITQPIADYDRSPEELRRFVPRADHEEIASRAFQDGFFVGLGFAVFVVFIALVFGHWWMYP